MSLVPLLSHLNYFIITKNNFQICPAHLYHLHVNFTPLNRLFLRWGVWFREQQFVLQLRLGLFWGRRFQGRVRRRLDGRRGGSSSAGADDGEGERTGAVQPNWEERGAKETVSSSGDGDDDDDVRKEGTLFCIFLICVCVCLFT